MDGLAPTRPVYNRWLPYWAVYQADMHQTLRSWVYRAWVFLALLAAAGFIVYRLGLTIEVGVAQSASRLASDLLRWTILGSVTLIVAMTAGCISSERGTMADSVLSRGISRYQYFLGKWHSRLTTVLLTFVGLSSVVLVACWFLLHVDLSLPGCLMAMATVAAVLAAVVSCGVTISAMCNSTVLGVALLWIFLYGGGFALSLLPASVATPDRILNALPFILKGEFNPEVLGRLIGYALGTSVAAALVGMAYFARRDI